MIKKVRKYITLILAVIMTMVMSISVFASSTPPPPKTDDIPAVASFTINEKGITSKAKSTYTIFTNGGVGSTARDRKPETKEFTVILNVAAKDKDKKDDAIFTVRSNNRAVVDVEPVTGGFKVTAVGNGKAVVTLTDAKAGLAKPKTAKINFTVNTYVDEITVTNNSFDIGASDKKTGSLTLNVAVNGDATNKKVNFKLKNATDSSIATVNAKGVVASKKSTAATKPVDITISSADGKCSINQVVTVIQNKVDTVNILYPAPSNFATARNAAAYQYKYQMTTNPSNDNNTIQIVAEGRNSKKEVVLDADLIYTSNKPAIATVDENGLVTARGNGAAKITVAARDGVKVTGKAVIDVTVTTEPLAINIAKPVITTQMNKKYTIKLGATVDAKLVATGNRQLNYEVIELPEGAVLDKDIELLKSKGLFTGSAIININAKKGSYRIKVSSAKNPKVFNFVNIEVLSGFPEEIKIAKPVIYSEANKTINNLGASVANSVPITGNKALTYEFVGPTPAGFILNETTGRLTIPKDVEGSYRIKVTAVKNPSVENYVEVRVGNITNKVTVSVPTPQLAIGGVDPTSTTTATVKVEGKGGSDSSFSEVTFTSTNPKVAEVDPKTGRITAFSKGTANISATSADGKKSNAAKVTVTQWVSDINVAGAKKEAGINNYSVKVTADSKVKLTASVVANGANNNTLKDAVNDSGITVKKTGNVYEVTTASVGNYSLKIPATIGDAVATVNVQVVSAIASNVLKNEFDNLKDVTVKMGSPVTLDLNKWYDGAVSEKLTLKIPTNNKDGRNNGNITVAGYTITGKKLTAFDNPVYLDVMYGTDLIGTLNVRVVESDASFATSLDTRLSNFIAGENFNWAGIQAIFNTKDKVAANRNLINVTINNPNWDATDIKSKVKSEEEFIKGFFDMFADTFFTTDEQAYGQITVSGNNLDIEAWRVIDEGYKVAVRVDDVTTEYTGEGARNAIIEAFKDEFYKAAGSNTLMALDGRVYNITVTKNNVGKGTTAINNYNAVSYQRDYRLQFNARAGAVDEYLKAKYDAAKAEFEYKLGLEGYYLADYGVSAVDYANNTAVVKLGPAKYDYDDLLDSQKDAINTDVAAYEALREEFKNYIKDVFEDVEKATVTVSGEKLEFLRTEDRPGNDMSLRNLAEQLMEKLGTSLEEIVNRSISIDANYYVFGKTHNRTYNINFIPDADKISDKINNDIKGYVDEFNANPESDKNGKLAFDSTTRKLTVNYYNDSVEEDLINNKQLREAVADVINKIVDEEGVTSYSLFRGAVEFKDFKWSQKSSNVSSSDIKSDIMKFVLGSTKTLDAKMSDLKLRDDKLGIAVTFDMEGLGAKTFVYTIEFVNVPKPTSPANPAIAEEVVASDESDESDEVVVDEEVAEDAIVEDVDEVVDEVANINEETEDDIADESDVEVEVEE